MKNYSYTNRFHFLVSVSILLGVIGLFLLIDTAKDRASDQETAKSNTPTHFFEAETAPLPKSPISSASTKKNQNKTSIETSIVTQWDVKGWKLDCPIQPFINPSEKGKAVFKIKINQHGRLVAIETLGNLSNISNEGIESFKTVLEIELENCLIKNNVKIEPISTGNVTFFVN